MKRLTKKERNEKLNACRTYDCIKKTDDVRNWYYQLYYRNNEIETIPYLAKYERPLNRKEK